MSTLTLPVPHRFDLARAVCSYGYFILAPNRWDIARQRFARPLRLPDESLVLTQARQRNTKLIIDCDRSLDRAEQHHIKRAYQRMLRFDEDFKPWRQLHPKAAKRGFERLFRSPTFWEDAVKTITGCNVTWTNTIRMNQLLCEHYGDGGFPSARKLARLKPESLKKKCKVGYRAERIVRLAKAIESGDLDPSWFEDKSRTTDELFKKLKSIHGFGDYAANNMLQLLGRYDRLAIDSETYRHFCKLKNIDRPQDPSELHPGIERYYNKFGDYKFLAYWFELWQGYEKYVGEPAHRWGYDDGGSFTASQLNKR